MRLDWAGMLRLGLGRLQLHPQAFWRLTPAELWLMLGLEAGPEPLPRARLEALARAFPDRGKEDGNDG